MDYQQAVSLLQHRAASGQSEIEGKGLQYEHPANGVASRVSAIDLRHRKEVARHSLGVLVVEKYRVGFGRRCRHGDRMLADYCSIAVNGIGGCMQRIPVRDSERGEVELVG